MLIKSQSSRAAFECSLDEVLNVFLQLHQNDGIEEIPPFSLTLSLQLKFTSSISVLKHAAANGQGISHFGVMHSGEEEEADEYHDQYADGEYGNQEGEEYDEQYYQHDGTDGEHEDGDYNQGAERGFEQEADTNDYHEYYQDQETANQGQEEYYHDDRQDYYEGQGEDQYYDEQPDEAAQLLDDHALEGEGLLQASADAVHDAPEAQIAATEEAAQESRETAEEGKDASTATSTTLQGDDGLDTTGEYTDEDYIDWDDLTSDPSEQSNGADLDSSTLLQGDGDETQNTSLTAGQKQLDTTVDTVYKALEDGTGGDNTATARAGLAQQNLASEDSLGEFGEHYDYHDTTQQPDHDPAPATEEQQEHGQDQNKTDDPTQQQEDPPHPTNLPAEVEDLFETASDDTVATTTNGKQQDPQPQPQTNTTPHDPNEDFIDFGDDDDVVPTPAPAVSTPKAKRSYEDLIGGEDEIDFESPEPKKSKVS